MAKLEALGLDTRSAAVYAALCTLPPSKAADVATCAGLGRTETYRILQDLASRGFVTAALGRPVRYQAVPVADLLDQLSAAQAAQAARLAAAREELPALLAPTTPLPTARRAAASFRIVQGRLECYRLAQAMWERAERVVEVVSTHPQGQDFSARVGLPQTIAHRTGQGIEGRAVLARESLGIPQLLETAPRLSIRVVDDAPFMRFVVVDRASLLFWVASDPSSDLTAQKEVAIWSDAVELVRTHEILFRSLWDEAAPFEGPPSDPPGGPSPRRPQYV